MLYNRKLIVRHFKSNKIKGILADTYRSPETTRQLCVAKTPRIAKFIPIIHKYLFYVQVL